MSSKEEQEKYITISRAYLLGLHYIQEAVVDNIKDPKKVEKYKEKFFSLCDTAMEDIFLASAKPKHRALNLLSEINKERLSLLRYINQLKNDDPTNVATIHRLEQYASLSLQTYGQIITAYNQHQPLPELKIEKISIPSYAKNLDINSDNCNLKVTNFVPPPTKEKNVSYTIEITHALTSTKNELYSGKIDKNSTIEATFSGIDKYKQEPSKLPRLARSKFIFEITQKSKTVLKKKEESLGECKLPMHLLEGEYFVQKQFKLNGGGTFDVEASIREPLLHPKQKVETISIRISESLNSNIRAATTSNVPQPTAQQPAQKAKQGSGATRKTTTVPNPKALPTTNNAPSTGLSTDQKKQKAMNILKNSFPLLPKEELLQFIDTTSIELMENVFKESSFNIKKMNLEMPDEYVRQNEILVKKKEKLSNDIQSGKISIDDYKQMLQKQIVRNRAQMKQSKNPMIAAFLGKSADNMEEQLKSFDEEDDE